MILTGFSFKLKGGARVAPGVRRLVLPEDQPRALTNPSGIPLTLTLRDGPARHGILAPDGSTPWGCLFFILFGVSLMVAIFSRNWAVVLSLAGLILLWGFYNHPRRQAAEPVMTALGRIGQGHGGEAVREMNRALDKLSDGDGIHYMAALAQMTAGGWQRALEHLELAELKFRQYAEYHHLMAMTYKALGRDELALEALGRVREYADYPHRETLDRDLQ